MKSKEEKLSLGEKLYQQGLSLTKIGKQLQLNPQSLSKFLKNKGYEIHNKQNESDIYYNIFDNIDTEEKAYWLGFLYADGSINRIYLELTLKESDKMHLEKFKKFLNARNKISYRPKQKAYRIMIGNKYLIESLKEKGCVENKTYKIVFPSEDILPKQLIRHFVRGFIDGDGYIGIGYQKNGLIKGRLSVCGAVPNFLLDLIHNMNWKVPKLKKNKRSSTYSYEWGSYLGVLEMLSQLYENSNIYLDRKYQKYIDLKNAVIEEAI